MQGSHMYYCGQRVYDLQLSRSPFSHKYMYQTLSHQSFIFLLHERLCKEVDYILCASGFHKKVIMA